MKKTFLLLTFLIGSLFGYSQTWSDDFGLIDSIYIESDFANVKDLFNDGDSVLYIAGPFTYVNLQNTYQVLKWNGYNYYLLQNGISSGGINIVTRFNNQILFGGDFTHVNSIPNTARLVAWNGTSWQSVGGGGISGEVCDLTAYNDTLFIGGYFGQIGSVAHNKVAAFSNNNWISISDNGFGNFSAAMEIFNKELYASAWYWGIRRYLGNGEWEMHPDQPNGYIYELKSDTTNSFLYVCGGFNQVGDSTSYGVAMWDGFKWNYMDAYCQTTLWPQSVAIYRGDLFTGCGRYYDNETEFRAYITRWNGETWDSIGGAFNSTIFALEVFRDTLYIGGSFTHWGGDSPIPTHRSKGLVKLYMPDNGCDYLKPRINTYADTFYLNGGEVDVNLYNNNPYVDSWEWDFTSTSSVTIPPPSNERNPIVTFSEVGEYNVQVTVTDGECVKTTNKTIYIELGNDVAQFEQIDMQVHPNPSSNDFTVKVTLPNYNNAEIKIAGLNGHLKSVIPVAGETTAIPTKGWKAGVYVCNLFVEGKLVKVEKLVFE
jgi:hypothetical protein